MAALISVGTSSAGQAQEAELTTLPDPRFALAEHAIDRITATITPRPTTAAVPNDDRISQVVETVRAIVSDTLTADAKTADAMQSFCITTIYPPMPTTIAAPELKAACADYLLARIKLAKASLPDKTNVRALRRLSRNLRRAR